MIKKGLILITSGFPLDTNEPFLVPEYAEICKAFDHVILVPIDTTSKIIVYPISSNTIVFKPEKPKVSLLGFIHKQLWKECLMILMKKRKIKRWLALKTAVNSWLRSSKLKQQIAEQLTSDVEWTVYSFWTDDAAIVSSLLFKDKKVTRTVSRAHGFDVYEKVHSNPYLPFRNFIFKTIDQIVTDSKHGAEHINLMGNHVLKNSAFQMHLGTENKLDLTLNISPSKLHIITCATVVPVKRLDKIAESLMEWTGVELIWTHFGGGDGLPALQEKCNTLPSSISVRFKGHCSHEEIMSFYSECTEIPLYINVSSSEGVPVAVMEAFSFGFPALVTDVGGNGEIVSNEWNGWVLPEDFTAKMFKDKLLLFFGMTEQERRELSLNAKRTQREQFDSLINAKRLVGLLLRQ